MKRIFLAYLWAALALPSIALAQTALDSATLHPGDVVRIAVWRHPDFSGDFPIGADGSITHPLFRALHVAGKPISTVETEFRQFLTQYDADPAFTFSPLQRIFVVGEVRQPNTLTVPPGTTVAEAIAVAGGPSSTADLQKVQLIRAGSITPIDLTRPDLSATRLVVQSGDQILVGRSRSVLRDYVGPIAALVGGLAALANIVIQANQ